MRMTDLMQPRVLRTFPEESVAAAAARMRDHGIGALAVVDEDQNLVGIVTERDLLCAIADGRAPRFTAVERYMSRVPVAVAPDTDSATAARLMVEHEIRHLPVTVGERVVGMVSARDLLLVEAWSRVAEGVT
jgi:CBS domain-containing protein